MSDVWSAPPFSLHLDDTRGSFWASLLRLKNRCDEDVFMVAVVVMWKQWEIRNNEAHG